jgi:ATP-dependent Zn protease
MTREESERRAIVYHEAAHAVVALTLGIRFKHVTIIPVEGILGHVLCESVPMWFNPELHLTDCSRVRGESQIIVSLAGHIAELTYLGRRLFFGAEDDQRRASAIAKHLSDSLEAERALLKRLFLRASELVSARWPEIQAIATALEERKTLSHDETREIISSRAAQE